MSHLSALLTDGEPGNADEQVPLTQDRAVGSQKMKPRTVIADDHDLIVEGLRHTLNLHVEIVGSYSNGLELTQGVARLNPDLAILDISMPLLNGIEAARQIRTTQPSVRIIFLSMHSDADYVREAFRAGGSAYVLKRSAVGELGKAVDEVMAGRHYVSPAVTRDTSLLLNEAGPASFGRDLTPRQRQVLQLLAEGKIAKEIAGILNISVKTVEFHKTSIMDSLGMRTTAELTRYALEHGMVSSRI